LLKGALPHNSFCAPIRYRLENILRGLSESTQHPYHPDSSPLQHRRRRHGHLIEGIFFWEKIRFVLDAALWTYYVNFPLLFHPVDILRKFGFAGPVGVLVDFHVAEIVRRSLSEADYDAFKAHSLSQENVAAVLEWALGKPDLSDV